MLKNKTAVVFFMLIFTTMLSSFAFYFWQVIYTPNVMADRDDTYVFIPTGSDYEYVRDLFYKKKYVKDPISFGLVARTMNYTKQVKPGMYLIKSNTSNREAIKMLRSGEQTPLLLTIPQTRTIFDLAGRISKQIETDSASLIQYFLKDSVLKEIGYTQETIPSLFIPNSYEVYWTIKPHQLLNRMRKEYGQFWNETRILKAKRQSLTPLQVITLASIVDAETNVTDEMPTIAGVYLNRLKIKMPLQADPTLVFAQGDFTIKRVLNEHKQIDSPYNTYKYAGLPPGPILLPSITAIEAVLNPESHAYLYFCANDDFSGSHLFAKTYTEHLKNAQKYQKALGNINR